MVKKQIFRHILLMCLIFSKFSFANSGDKLHFEENKGQWDQRVLYRLTLKNIEMLYENKSITYCMYDLHELLSHGHPKSKEKILADKSTAYFYSYRVDFIDANKNVSHAGEQPIETYHNYYLGNDPEKWTSGVKLFNEVNYKNLYPGITLKIYSQDMFPKHDFIVKAGADVSKIAMQYTGASSLRLQNGSLIVGTSLGSITEQAPYAYQNINGKKIPVTCNYKLNDLVVTFEFPNGYDKTNELIIDPILIGATFSGSTYDNWGFTATYDNAANIYSGGIATTMLGGFGYPVTPGAYQTTFGGGGSGGIYPWPWDIAIIKYNPTATTPIFATYLGGSENEFPHSMVVDANDNLYVYGKTYSINYPVSATAYSKTLKGGSDIIVTKFNAAGSALLGSTFIGGSNDDGVNYDAYESTFGGLKFNYGDDARGEVIVDQNNDCYVASVTKSTDFPTSTGAYKTTFAGGRQDGCVFKLTSDLSTLKWSTYLGGSSDDACFGLALDSKNNVYTAGGTMSHDFPTTTGVLNPVFKGDTADGFVSMIKADGSALMASTYIGTAKMDECYFVQCDKKDNVYVYGQTQGTYPIFPATVYHSTIGGLFIHKLNSTLTTTVFSTVIGDGALTYPNVSPSAFLVDNCDNIYISGWGGGLVSGLPGKQGNTSGLPVTSDAYKGTTDGGDFYLMSLSRDAATLIYATFFGDGVSGREHVDGGTSRFDKRGVVYQSACAGCGGTSNFPVTATAWSTTNRSSNCNNAVFKIDFQTPNVIAYASTTGVLGCAPLTYTFINGSANAASYKWDFGDGSAIDTAKAPSHTFVKGGTYTVKIIATNPLSCNLMDSSTVQVVVKPGPYIKFGPDIQMECDSLKGIKLDAGNPGSTYLWSSGDTTETIVPKSIGQYWVKVTYSGCSSTDTINLLGVPIPDGIKTLVPNVFSPNGDGKNDVLKITYQWTVTEFNIKIYNRWGLQVFESNDINNSWNGKIDGHDADDGTYYYILSLNSSCAKHPFNSNGFVTLLK